MTRREIISLLVGEHFVERAVERCAKGGEPSPHARHQDADRCQHEHRLRDCIHGSSDHSHARSVHAHAPAQPPPEARGAGIAAASALDPFDGLA
jgi:hypothetical protein